MVKVVADFASVAAVANMPLFLQLLQRLTILLLPTLPFLAPPCEAVPGVG